MGNSFLMSFCPYDEPRSSQISLRPKPRPLVSNINYFKSYACRVSFWGFLGMRNSFLMSFGPYDQPRCSQTLLSENGYLWDIILGVLGLANLFLMLFCPYDEPRSSQISPRPLVSNFSIYLKDMHVGYSFGGFWVWEIHFWCLSDFQKDTPLAYLLNKLKSYSPAALVLASVRSRRT